MGGYKNIYAFACIKKQTKKQECFTIFTKGKGREWDWGNTDRSYRSLNILYLTLKNKYFIWLPTQINYVKAILKNENKKSGK